jgi:hypothetical protein
MGCSGGRCGRLAELVGRVAPPDHQTGRWPPGIPGSGTKRPLDTVPISSGVRSPFLLGAALSLVVEMISCDPAGFDHSTFGHPVIAPLR